MENQKIVIDMLSDTHNQHEKFKCEGGDILLHSGDCTSRGGLSEAIKFMEWFGKQPYTHKVMIPGNHDWIFEENPAVMQEYAAKNGIHLLNDSGVILSGAVIVGEPSAVREGGTSIERYDIKVWGSPVQPWFHSWAFNRYMDERHATAKHPWIKPHWDMIPEGTEILLTHGPAYMILDKVVRGNFNVGCYHLAKRIEELGVSLHVCGHIHEGKGFHYGPKTTYVNASSLDERYWAPEDSKPMRVIREICLDGSIAYVL
jgi:predicted MPP superfamily phosphohydrolase